METLLNYESSNDEDSEEQIQQSDYTATSKD